MYRTIVMLTSLAVLLGGAIGCDSTQSYNESNKQAASAITPRAGWTISSSSDVLNPELALDGNVSTAAQSGTNQQGAWVTIDLGKTCLFNTVIVDHGTSEQSYAGRVAIYTSTDGENFTYRFTGPGNRRVSLFSLVTPVLGRYVRLEVVKPQGGNYEPTSRTWALAEIYLR